MSAMEPQARVESSSRSSARAEDGPEAPTGIWDSVQIVGTQTCSVDNRAAVLGRRSENGAEGSNNKPFTQYRLRIRTNDGRSWDEYKRYNEFKALRESLIASGEDTVRLPWVLFPVESGVPRAEGAAKRRPAVAQVKRLNFPKKHMRRKASLKEERVCDRHATLQAWVDEVMQLCGEHGLVGVFLGLQQHARGLADEVHIPRSPLRAAAVVHHRSHTSIACLRRGRLTGGRAQVRAQAAEIDFLKGRSVALEKECETERQTVHTLKTQVHHAESVKGTMARRVEVMREEMEDMQARRAPAPSPSTSTSTGRAPRPELYIRARCSAAGPRWGLELTRRRGTQSELDILRCERDSLHASRSRYLHQAAQQEQSGLLAERRRVQTRREQRHSPTPGAESPEGAASAADAAAGAAKETPGAGAGAGAGAAAGAAAGRDRLAEAQSFLRLKTRDVADVDRVIALFGDSVGALATPRQSFARRGRSKSAAPSKEGSLSGAEQAAYEGLRVHRAGLERELRQQMRAAMARAEADEQKLTDLVLASVAFGDALASERSNHRSSPTSGSLPPPPQLWKPAIPTEAGGALTQPTRVAGRCCSNDSKTCCECKRCMIQRRLQ
jgi:hypothetical protein